MQNRRIAKIVRKLQDLPGQGLFQYVDQGGAVHDVTSQDVTDYLREITGEDFTAEDFRTWAGTLLAAMALNAQETFRTKKQARANIKDAISAVSKMLGNEGLKNRAEETLTQDLDDLRSDEIAALTFLHQRLEKKTALTKRAAR